MFRYRSAILRGSFRSNLQCNFMLISFMYFTILIFSTFPWGQFIGLPRLACWACTPLTWKTPWRWQPGAETCRRLILVINCTLWRSFLDDALIFPRTYCCIRRNINLNDGGGVKFVVTCRRYDPDHHKAKNCRYNNNKGYVVFSAMGSFFIPLTVMIYVYARISCVVAQRHNQLAALDNNDQVLCILCQLIYIHDRNAIVQGWRTCEKRKDLLGTQHSLLPQFVLFSYFPTSVSMLWRIGMLVHIQRDSKRWTQFRTSIVPERYMVCEWST